MQRRLYTVRFAVTLNAMRPLLRILQMLYSLPARTREFSIVSFARGKYSRFRDISLVTRIQTITMITIIQSNQRNGRSSRALLFNKLQNTCSRNIQYFIIDTLNKTPATCKQHLHRMEIDVEFILHTFHTASSMLNQTSKLPFNIEYK